MLGERAPHLLPDIIPLPARSWPWVESELEHFGQYGHTTITGANGYFPQLITGRAATITDTQAAALINADPGEAGSFPNMLLVLLVLRPQLLALLHGVSGHDELVPRLTLATGRAEQIATHLQGPCTRFCPYVQDPADREVFDRYLALLAMAQVPGLHPVHAQQLFTELAILASTDPEDLETDDEGDPTYEALEIGSIAGGVLELVAPLLGSRAPSFQGSWAYRTPLWTRDRSGHHPVAGYTDEVQGTECVLVAEVLTDLISGRVAHIALWSVVLGLLPEWPGTLVELVNAAAAILTPPPDSTTPPDTAPKLTANVPNHH